MVRRLGREDDVIEEADTQDLTRSGHSLGDLAVLGAGTGVGAGMVVSEYECGDAGGDGGLGDLAGMDQRLLGQLLQISATARSSKPGVS